MSLLAIWAVVSALDATAVAQQAAVTNVIPLTVRTPRSGFNRMVVSLTVCAPGTDHCATIDNVMVDTGSTGLRLESSAVPTGLILPTFTDAHGRPLAECLRFLHDDAWGPLYRADLRIGGLAATNLPIQIIADDDRPRPAGCPTSTASPTANGTLGIGPHLFDCQGACPQDPDRPGVFVGENGSWVPFSGTVPVASRLPNPVSWFPEHANGVVVNLPATPVVGAHEIVGTLTFGVGTAANNRIGGFQVLRLDADGFFTTRYHGATLPKSYIDSGTGTYILADDLLPRCAGMQWAFCVAPARTLAATLVGTDGGTIQISFMVGDYRNALDRGVGAWGGFAELADGSSRAFVWGAPFFFGRRVALVFDGQATDDVGGVPGPFYAMP